MVFPFFSCKHVPKRREGAAFQAEAATREVCSGIKALENRLGMVRTPRRSQKSGEPGEGHPVQQLSELRCALRQHRCSRVQGRVRTWRWREHRECWTRQAAEGDEGSGVSAIQSNGPRGYTLTAAPREGGAAGRGQAAPEPAGTV